jgi:chitodextrinase
MWTIVDPYNPGEDTIADTLWVFEDFLSGQTQGVSAVEINADPGKEFKQVRVSWTHMNEDSNDEFPVLDGTVYIISYSYTDGDSTVTDYAYKDVRNVNAGSTVSCDIDDLLAATEYTIKVRVANDSPIQSRWSNEKDGKVTTGAYLYAPCPISPVQGQPQAATTSLNPTFTWATVYTAVSYEFQLSDNAAFTNIIDTQTLNVTGYTYLGDGLAYDTDYYWRVRAVGADGTKSAWSSYSMVDTLLFSYYPVGAPTSFHTMVDPEEYHSELTVTQTIPTITITQTQTNPTYTIPVPEFTVTVPAAQTTVTTQTHTITIPDEKTPAYIWAIVAIGALLTIAVIVLIIRTRRVV